MRRLCLLTISLILGLMSPVSLVSANAQQAYIIDIKGTLSPAIADYFSRSLNKAAEANAAFLLVRLDSAGGLDLSIRDMVEQILSSPVPVVVYVSPANASLTGAAAYLLYASHVSAMAPATRLGVAHQLLDTDKDKAQPAGESAAIDRKVIENAVIEMKGLAEQYGRDEPEADKIVNEAVMLTAESALENKVIDILAAHQSALIRQLDSRKVVLLGEEVTLKSKAVVLNEIQPDRQYKMLKLISNPNIVYILLVFGLCGLVLVKFRPSMAMVMAALSGLCLLMVLYAFLTLPVNYAGLALILMGVVLMVSEAFWPILGLLGLGGLAAFVSGSYRFIETGFPGYGMSMEVIAGMTILTVLVLLISLAMAKPDQAQTAGLK